MIKDLLHGCFEIWNFSSSVKNEWNIFEYKERNFMSQSSHVMFYYFFLYKHQWNTKPFHFTVRPGQATFQDFINEYVIQKLNLLVIAVMSMKLKSTFVLGQIEITLNGQNCFQDIYI